jgi:hypothetical protein
MKMHRVVIGLLGVSAAATWALGEPHCSADDAVINPSTCLTVPNDPLFPTEPETPMWRGDGMLDIKMPVRAQFFPKVNCKRLLV